jgi:HK97 gp10 family phage protein
MASEIEFKSYAADIKNAEEKAVEKALTMIGILVEGKAADNAPVDTGRLKNSITSYTDEQYAIIGTAVEYAPYVELGTSRSHEQPYLLPAVNQSQSNIKKILEQEFGK